MVDVLPRGVLEGFRFYYEDPLFINMRNGHIKWGDLLVTDEEIARNNERNRLRKMGELKDEIRSVSSFEDTLAKFGLDQTPNYPQIHTLVVKKIPHKLDYDQTRMELTTMFAKHGIVEDVGLLRNNDRSSPFYGTLKGIAFIRFRQIEDCWKAFEAEIDCSLCGNPVMLEFATEDRSPSTTTTVVHTLPSPSPLHKLPERLTIIVHNLPFDVEVRKLHAFLRLNAEQYGAVDNVFIPMNHHGPYSGSIKGLAFIKFRTIAQSHKAFISWTSAGLNVFGSHTPVVSGTEDG